MIKVGVMRFVVVIFVVFCINTHVLAKVSLAGPGTTQIVVDKEEFDLKIDFSSPAAKTYYNDPNHWGKENDEKTMFKLIVGGCQVEMWAEECEEYTSHIRVGKGTTPNNCLDDDKDNEGTMNSFNAIVTKKKINVTNPSRKHLTTRQWDGDFDACKPKFNDRLVRGRYVVDVSLTGPNVARDLITSIPGAEIYVPVSSTTTSTTTTQASTSTTTIPPTTTLAPTTDPCDEALSEPRYFCSDDGYVEDL